MLIPGTTLHWYGALFWADDGILLSTSVQGLHDLVNICQEHAKENDLLFSTDPNPNLSKTVCIVFNSPNSAELAPVMLNGDPPPTPTMLVQNYTAMVPCSKTSRRREHSTFRTA